MRCAPRAEGNVLAPVAHCQYLFTVLPPRLTRRRTWLGGRCRTAAPMLGWRYSGYEISDRSSTEIGMPSPGVRKQIAKNRE
jgi:hypothetical protein